MSRQTLVQPAGLTQFQRNKLEKDAKKNWDLFYKRNGDRFFKSRYWTRKEFFELFQEDEQTSSTRYLLEVGCGCGDFILPLLKSDNDERDNQSKLPRDLFIYCCDISEKAIDLLKDNEVYKRNSATRVNAFTANVISDQAKMLEQLNGNRMDYISLVFVLSALEPNTMCKAIENLHELMKPGGLLFFRDYAAHDKAMLRFDEKSKICDRFYVRQDGTRAYFFTENELLDYFVSRQLFRCQAIEYIHRETLNNATQDKHSRIFLQAKFVCLKESQQGDCQS